MIIYIHGFGGSGNGVKATLFKNLTSNVPIIAPSLSYLPSLAIMTLSELIETFQNSSDETLSDIQLIGSSLGGYYAHYLSHKYKLKAVLLNPALYPYVRLAQLKGQALNFADLSHFEWNDSHIEMLKDYDVAALADNKNILLLTQKGDEVLDYREAQEKLHGAKMIIEEGGNHSFDTIEKHLDVIASFLHVSFD